MNSLKRLIWLAFLVVGILLAAIIVLGIYQNGLSGKYNKIITQNEKTFFRFATIRESIIEILLTGNGPQIEQVLHDVESFNSNMARLREDKLVSAELQLTMVDKVDIAGLAILLKKFSSDESNRADGKRKIIERLRTISEYLSQYDRIITSQARERIVNFQLVVIGALGLIISLASFSLILLYRNTLSPLLALSQHFQNGIQVVPSVVLNQPVVKEIAELETVLIHLAGKAYEKNECNEQAKHLEKILADTTNETINRLNGMINYAQLLYDQGSQIIIDEMSREMLRKIIENGMSIAEYWQKQK